MWDKKVIEKCVHEKRKNFSMKIDFPNKATSIMAFTNLTKDMN